MRPLHLTLSGFRSYERTTELSFESRNLLAIVGPTGAGKSSILDGISYALYGKTPREQRAVKKLICSRSEEARVHFRFSVNERCYEITRVLRRKAGPAPHVLVDQSSGDKITGESSVTEKVIELVGLDFSAFSSSVLLAQGEFAHFLQATPTKRGQILKGVFRLEQIDALRDAARARVDQLGGDLRVIEGERRHIPADVDDRLALAVERKKAASRRVEVLATAIHKEQDLEAALRGAAGDLERAAGELDKLRSALEVIPTTDHLHQLEREGSSIDELIAEAGSSVAVATEERTAALAAREELEDQIGSETDLVELRSTAVELDRTTRAAAERDEAIAAQQRQLEKLRGELLVAEAAHSSGVEAAREATSAREKAEREHAAHALRGELQVGMPCPVCEAPVEAVPKRKRLTALDKLKAAERAALDALEDETGVASFAATALAVAEANRKHLVDDLAATRERARELELELEAALGEVPDALDAVQERLARLVDARAHIDAANQAVDQARQRLDERKALEQEFARLCRTAAAALIRVAAQAGVDPPNVDDPVARLCERAEVIGDALVRQISEVKGRVDGARRAEQEIGEGLEDLRTSLGVSPTGTVAEAFADARSELAVADSHCADLEKKRVRARELDEQEAAVIARQRLFKQLASDLTDRNFVSFLLEERTQLLFALASERLNAMTSRYRLEMDKSELNVVDELDGDKRRVVDTLSGGETFLASLALALALAELVTRSGGHLQCFFLDEGFGSLDPESFDLAMDGIERIVSHDRLIGLVSHVQALAARVDDRIELDKGADGMTVVRSGAALG